MSRKALQLALAVPVIVVCFAVGTSKIVSYVGSAPPDPASAEPADLVAYTISDGFRELSPADQLRFTQQAMGRYASMTDEQRKAIDRKMAELKKEDPGALRESIKQWFLSMAEQYLSLPPEQRGAWMDRNITMFQMMSTRSGQKDAERPRDEARKENEPMNVERQQEVVAFFNKEVFPKSTAKERAMFMAVIKDLGPRMRAMATKKKS